MANISNASLVNGDGCRVVVVFSGCTLDCKGCFSKELQNFTNGEKIAPQELAKVVLRVLNNGGKLIDGLTLSGGNPPEQPDMMRFLGEIKRQMPYLNLWMWSGFTMKEMEILYPEILERLDVIKTGRYIEKQQCDGMYYGSSNQEIWRKKGGEWIKDDN